MQFRGNNKGLRMRRRGSPIPKGGHGPPGKKKLIAGTSGWFQVTVSLKYHLLKYIFKYNIFVF